MNIFQQTDNNLIYVRTDNGTYEDTLTNFEKDFSGTYSGPPKSYVSFVYNQDFKEFVCTDSNGVDTLETYPWSVGDSAISDFSNLIKNQEARNTPPSPTVSKAKTQQKESILSMIPVKLSQGVTFQNTHYTTDQDFTTNVNSILNVINAGVYPHSTVTIKDSSNVPQTLSIDNFKKLAAQAIAFGQSVYQKAWSIEQEIENVGSEPNWKASTVYSKGDVIQESGYIYKVTQGGTSGSTKPTFSNAKGNATTDNNMIWECQGTLQDVIFAITWT